MKKKFTLTLLTVLGALMFLTANSQAGPGVHFGVVIGGPGYYGPAYYPPPVYYGPGYGYYGDYGPGWGYYGGGGLSLILVIVLILLLLRVI